MAKRQTRRSVSLNAAMHAYLDEHCRNQRIAMSSYVHQALAEKLGREGKHNPPPLYPTPYSAVENRRKTRLGRARVD